MNFNFTSSFLASTVWPVGHNFTFGGREIKYAGVHLNGYLTDIQIFSQALTKEEMSDYTLCTKVR